MYVFQSIRKAGIASFLSIMRSGAMLIPVLLAGSYFLGLTGIQLAQPIADVLTGIVSLPFMIMFIKKTPSTLEAKREEAMISSEK